MRIKKFIDEDRLVSYAKSGKTRYRWICSNHMYTEDFDLAIEIVKGAAKQLPKYKGIKLYFCRSKYSLYLKWN